MFINKLHLPVMMNSLLFTITALNLLTGNDQNTAKTAYDVV